MDTFGVKVEAQYCPLLAIWAGIRTLSWMIGCFFGKVLIKMWRVFAKLASFVRRLKDPALPNKKNLILRRFRIHHDGVCHWNLLLVCPLLRVVMLF
jgi:hypothetical protein